MTEFKKTILFAAIFVANLAFAAFNEPQPGEIYRDYYRIMSPGTVKDWRVTDPAAPHSGAQAFLPNSVLSLNIGDLQGAIKAEAILDLWGGHPGTTNKRLRFNSNPWIVVPELSTTPTPGECYTQQSNFTVDVPLSNLIQGNNNIEGTSGGQTCYDFGWGQWGWYGIIVRVYYNTSKPHATGQITSHSSGGTITENSTIAVTPQGGANVSRVEFLGFYENYDTDGDGVYRDWQRNYHRGYNDTEVKARNHIGTATASPWQVTWNTDWVPDQPAAGVKLIARIRDNNGVWFVTDIVDNLTLTRTNGSVKLYKPTDVGESFWVRAGQTRSCTIPIPPGEPLPFATAAKLYIATWNGVDGQGNGDHWKRVNSWNAPIVGDNHYYALNEISVPVSALIPGNNIFSFYAGSEHHGVEMMWPGPAISVRYSLVTSVGESATPKSFRLSQNYPNPFNPTTVISYELPEPAEITLKVIDVLGHEVTTLTGGTQQAGYFTVGWDGKNSRGVQVGSGTYIYRLEARSPSGEYHFAAKTMLLVK